MGKKGVAAGKPKGVKSEDVKKIFFREVYA